MSLNYDPVSHGVLIALIGHFFVPETQLLLHVDEKFLGALSTTPTGNFVVFLEITGEGEGSISLEIYSTTETLLSINLTVDDGYPTHLKEGDGQTFELEVTRK